jgi:hypothetical protein
VTQKNNRCVALRLYVDTLNTGIPRSVGKVALPDPPFGKIEIKAGEVKIAPAGAAPGIEEEE